VDLTATVSAIKAERETRPVRIVAAGFLIKKAPAEADAFSEKTLAGTKGQCRNIRRLKFSDCVCHKLGKRIASHGKWPP
jgi:hypothetical protein